MFILSRKVVICGILGLIVAIVVVAVGLFFGLKKDNQESVSGSLVRKGVGAVVANGLECANIGGSILNKDGSVVDAAIATLFCEGVAMPQSTGIGGGFFMVIYVKEHKTVITLDARETAPLRATENMYGGNASLSYKGGLSIAVPGELRGYWEAHQRFGRLPWSELVQPSIDLCKTGHKVTAYFENVLKKQETNIRKDPGLKATFINPATNQIYKEGDLIKQPLLASTLEIIARDGANALYDGALTEGLLNDIKSVGGIISKEDLIEYKPVWNEPIVAQLPDNLTLYTMPPPGSGVILTFMVNILQNFLETTNINLTVNWQRIVETFKYAYAKRTELGDPPFVEGIDELIRNLTSFTYATAIRQDITDDKTFEDPEHYGANFSLPSDYGTAHISVLGKNGDSVAVTGTINQIFGSGFMSPSTGIILNDEMDDFSSPNITNGFGLPPSPANFIRPGKRPLSSMSPTIIVDKNGTVVLTLGAAGGSKITSTVALVTTRHLWFKQSLKTAIFSPRLHHQLLPMQIDYESDFNKNIMDELKTIGHQTLKTLSTDGFAALTGVSYRDGVIEASTDPRRGGSVCILH